MKTVSIRLVTLIVCIVATIAGAVFLEILLDLAGLESAKHILGTTSSLLLLISLIYSLRKRKIIFKSGCIKHWLVIHEWLAIVGAALIFVHGGFHAHAAVPLITNGVMFITVVSGLTGRYLYSHAYEELRSRKKDLEKRGLEREEIENTLSSLAAAHKFMKHWRTIHVPIVFVLAMTVAFHVLSALYYDGIWR